MRSRFQNFSSDFLYIFLIPLYATQSKAHRWSGLMNILSDLQQLQNSDFFMKTMLESGSVL